MWAPKSIVRSVKTRPWRAFIKVSTSEQQLVSKRCLCIRTIIKASIFKFFFVSQDIIKFINRNRNIFTFVTNIQDETHRYANDYRKRAMKKRSYAATLTAIPGVGEKTSAALLAHFKTVAAVKAASISDLEEVKGISHAKAEMLYNALRNGV